MPKPLTMPILQQSHTNRQNNTNPNKHNRIQTNRRKKMKDKNRPWRIGLTIGVAACAATILYLAKTEIEYLIAASFALLIGVVFYNEIRIEKSQRLIETDYESNTTNR